jgi:hypothetical protein
MQRPAAVAVIRGAVHHRERARRERGELADIGRGRGEWRPAAAARNRGLGRSGTPPCGIEIPTVLALFRMRPPTRARHNLLMVALAKTSCLTPSPRSSIAALAPTSALRFRVDSVTHFSKLFRPFQEAPFSALPLFVRSRRIEKPVQLRGSQAESLRSSFLGSRLGWLLRAPARGGGELLQDGTTEHLGVPSKHPKPQAGPAVSAPG